MTINEQALADYFAARKAHSKRPVKTLGGIYVNPETWKEIARAVGETIHATHNGKRVEIAIRENEDA